MDFLSSVSFYLNTFKILEPFVSNSSRLIFSSPFPLTVKAEEKNTGGTLTLQINYLKNGIKILVYLLICC